MRHTTAKFGSLVHRFGMISIGLRAREFFEIDFGLFWTPQIGGILRGAPAFLHKSEATVIKNTPHISKNRKGFSSIASDVERELFY